MTDPYVIDTVMHRKVGITAAYVLRGEQTALLESGPKSSLEHVLAGLDAAGVDHLDWIIVTHIHLDHAGAAGTLAQRFPDARVGVHEVGAPHLADPSKLWSSAARIYGDRMEELWGGIDPIAPERIHVIADQDVIDLGGLSLRAIETPGHAYHHHSFLVEDSGLVFTGDALGVRLPEVGVVRPATPPPEFHLEKAITSIERIRALGASRLFPTHFGPHDDGERVQTAEGFCDEAIEALRTWADWVREARTQTRELDEAAELVTKQARSELEATLDEEAIARMDNTTSYRMNTWGYMRYLDKAAEAGARAPH
ncbi:MAG: MBL fold metallo-hydrolase [Actinomycetota bacterium]|nr:MBL fold metallo-hydrolase [Actinomycetota bacterium]